MSLCELCVSYDHCHFSLDECEEFGCYVPKVTVSPTENVTCGDCLNRGIKFKDLDYCYKCKAGSNFAPIPYKPHQVLSY